MAEQRPDPKTSEPEPVEVPSVRGPIDQARQEMDEQRATIEEMARRQGEKQTPDPKPPAGKDDDDDDDDKRAKASVRTPPRR